MKISLSKSEIEHVFQHKQSFHTTNFLIRWKPASTAHHRVAFTFSRTIGNAIFRNRFKRRFRELLRHHTDAPHFHFVISSKKKLKEISCADFDKDKTKLTQFLKGGHNA